MIGLGDLEINILSSFNYIIAVCVCLENRMHSERDFKKYACARETCVESIGRNGWNGNTHKNQNK